MNNIFDTIADTVADTVAVRLQGGSGNREKMTTSLAKLSNMAPVGLQFEPLKRYPGELSLGLSRTSQTASPEVPGSSFTGSAEVAKPPKIWCSNPPRALLLVEI